MSDDGLRRSLSMPDMRFAWPRPWRDFLSGARPLYGAPPTPSDEAVLGSPVVSNAAELPHETWQILPRVHIKRHLGSFLHLHESGLGVLIAVQRGPDPRVVRETIPVAVSLSMRALFCNPVKVLVKTSEVHALLERATRLEGAQCDKTGPHVLHRIRKFVKVYNIDVNELLDPDLTHYETFNEFFYRRLGPGARPQAQPDDASVITSAADCRLTVFDNVAAARRFWIKGKHFTIRDFVLDDELGRSLDGGSLAIFRLAPADYHRYHAPFDGKIELIRPILGTYYTVNPVAVNENLDVLTSNKRHVTRFFATQGQCPVALVAVGAFFVGSIRETRFEGEAVSRGEELGHFAYGGSTLVAIFPPDTVNWDDDLLANSEDSLETLVRVGDKIGAWTAASDIASDSALLKASRRASPEAPVSPVMPYSRPLATGKGNAFANSAVSLL